MSRLHKIMIESYAMNIDLMDNFVRTSCENINVRVSNFARSNHADYYGYSNSVNILFQPGEKASGWL